MSASASSLSAPAPPAMVLQATGRIAVLPHGTAGAAVKGSAAPPGMQLSQHRRYGIQLCYWEILHMRCRTYRDFI